MVKTLQKAGFAVIRVKGSHHFLIHPDGRRTVLSMPKKR
ncbi:type II toxin-antitoxin system HicA family toxin [Synechocystis sp. LKSZ1]